MNVLEKAQARVRLRERAERISVGNGSANHADLREDAKEMALAVLDLLDEATAVRDRDDKAMVMTSMMGAWKAGLFTAEEAMRAIEGATPYTLLQLEASFSDTGGVPYSEC